MAMGVGAVEGPCRGPVDGTGTGNGGGIAARGRIAETTVGTVRWVGVVVEAAAAVEAFPAAAVPPVSTSTNSSALSLRCPINSRTFDFTITGTSSLHLFSLSFQCCSPPTAQYL